MRIILKIFAVPFVIILTPLVALLSFLFCYAVIVLHIISGIGVLIGDITLMTGQTFNGLILLGLAFLISPFGIPAIAGWMVDKLDDLNYSLKNFITN
jgi:hypothetical protein